MTDGNTRKKAQAVFFSLVMVLSMVGGTVAFAGGAAANAQDITSFDAENVVAGTSSVNQTVTLAGLENDGSAETINITPDTNLNTELVDARLVDSGDHEITDSNVNINTTPSINTIEVDLGADSGATDDVVLEIEYNLDGNTANTPVTYTASFPNGQLSDQTTNFQITHEQPSFGDGAATVQDSGGDTGSQILVTFDEDIQTAKGVTDADIANAFNVSGAQNAAGNELTVIGGDTDPGGANEIQLELDGYISSDIDTGALNVDYQGETDNGGEFAGSGDVIVHALDSSVPALSSSEDTSPTGETRPTLESAEITDFDGDGRPDLVVNFSEEIDAADGVLDAANVFTFGPYASNGTVIENGNNGNQDRVVLGVDPVVEPADNFSDLNYDKTADNDGNIVATNGSNKEAAIASGSVSNTVAPELSSASVTEANPDQITVTFSSDSKAALESGTDALSEGFTLQGTSASITDELAGSGFNNGEVTIQLSENVEAGDGTLTLNYSAGSDAVQSVAGVSAVEGEVNPTNNVVPTFESAEVTNDNPDQLRVTFTEDVVTNVSDGNIDNAVTDAFTFDDVNDDGPYRVRNLSSHSGDTIVLNLGQEDGTSVEVSSTADLTGALTYDPAGPTGAEADPFIADGGTNEPVGYFDNKDVANNVGITAQLTERGQYLEVTFTEDITRAGTPSEVVSEFDTSGTDIVLTDESFEEIKNGDTVVFNNGDDHTVAGDVVNTPSAVNSGTSVTVDYTSSGALVNSQDEQPADFTGESVTNNIQPFITDVTESESNIQLTYSENVVTPSDATAFSLSGTSAELSGTTDETPNNQFKLDLEPSFDGSGAGTLSYADADGSSVNSDVTATVALDETVDVTDPVSPAPQLVSATVDDVGANNDDDANGEIVLTFDRDVKSTGDAVDGLAFESNNQDVSIEFQDTDTVTGEQDNQIAVEFTSTSGSASSAISAGEDLSNAVLTIDTPAAVDIQSTDGGAVQQGDSTDQVSNEIAGDADSVETLEIDIDVLPTTNKGEVTHDLSVTVENLTDSDGNAVKQKGSVSAISIQNESGAEVTTLSVTDINRFDSTDVTVSTESGISGNFDSSVGENVTANLAGAESDSAEVVHEAFNTPSSAGYFLDSQPMSGELVLGNESQFGDINYYDAEADGYEGYAGASNVDTVHNALFIESLDSSATYGYVYDENRDVSEINVGSVDMSEGWHIVGSNYDVSGDSSITLNEDLSLQGDINGTSVSVQQKSLPGTTLEGDSTVGNNEAYYVFLQEGDTRPIVLPEYDPDA